ncbi:MAG: hypothetical protein AAFR21_00390 [Pseudomonadota bacterium]
MPKTLTVEATYAGDPDKVFASAIHFDEMKTVMAPLACYEGLPSESAIEGNTYTLRTKFWGWLDVGPHTIFLETLDTAGRRLQSREHNASIRRWDHLLTVEPHRDGALWRDQIELEAGWRTFAVARFARYVYRFRHRQRPALSLTSHIR